MGGGLMQLVAYGAQDIYLTGNPQITFFKVVYRRHTNFSMECIRQTFKGTPAAGNRVVATISRNGDLVHDCFIKVGAHASQSPSNEGHNMFDNIELEIGGQLIDKHYGHWMEAHAELTEQPFMCLAQGTTTAALMSAGGDGTDLDSYLFTPFQATTGACGLTTGTQQMSETNVPLRFWFCRHVGLSLPLIALQYHEVNINVTFSSGTTNAPPLTSLWCNYIYLDTDERRRFAQVSHEYLIEQVQMQTFTGDQNGTTLKLNFNHPVKELIWGAVKFAWGGANAAGSTAGSFEPLVAAAGTADWQLKLNGHDRFEKQDITYFTRYQPYKYHNNIGKSPGDKVDTIGVYSFALKPEEHQPSGTCNFSRIDNAQLIYSSLNEGLNAKSLYVYAVNYNVLRIMSGMGGLAYSN